MFKKALIPAGILTLFALTHFWSLTLLPVFADESIYIRWAQLLMDDWHQYLFFALNDGKTPLFIWSLVPFQHLFSDQLYAARFVAVLVGFFQLFVTKEIVKAVGGRQKAQWLSMLMVTILPFWYIYHRFALMDGMLTLFLSLTVLGTLNVVKISSVKTREYLKWTAFTGISLGLALWSKLPALFVLPALPFFLFLAKKESKHVLVQQCISLGASTFLGLVIFALLKVSPSFSQLFHRSSDFIFPVQEVLFQGKWQQTLPSIPNYLAYFWVYLTWPVLLLAVSGIFSKKNRKVSLVFLALVASLSGIFFVFGKVVYSRYFLPVALPFTVLAAINAQALYDKYFTQQPKMSKKMIAAVIITILFGSMISESFQFILPALTSPTTIPFVSSDKEQYLTTWSAGIGIPETVEYIRQQSKNHSIAVATEGRFGTLPDGLSLYFHDRDVDNIYIEGTEQYPVKTLPSFFIKRAQTFDQSILVVNSDRMQLPINQSASIAQYCRPFASSCLQIWDITAEVKSSVMP